MSITSDQKSQIVSLIRRKYPEWTDFEYRPFMRDEINTKRLAVKKASALLSESTLAHMLVTRETDGFIERLERLGKATSLLERPGTEHGDLEILYVPTLDKPVFCAQVYHLLHGTESAQERLAAYLRYIEDHELPNSWTFPTYLLFFSNPRTEFFVEPQPTEWFLKYIGLSPYLGKPSADTYLAIKEFAHGLKHALGEYRPHDMIDIQSLIRVCAAANQPTRAPEPEPVAFWSDEEAEDADATVLHPSNPLAQAQPQRPPATPAQTSPTSTDRPATPLDQHYRAFLESFMTAPPGIAAAVAFARSREQAEQHFAHIVAEHELGEVVTERVFLHVLPHADTREHVTSGAWIHPMPAMDDALNTLSRLSSTDREQAATALLELTRQCVYNPKGVAGYILRFKQNAHTSAFQSRHISPMLHALKPGAFIVGTDDAVSTINFFSGTAYTGRIEQYPDLNEAGLALVRYLHSGSNAFGVKSVQNTDLFALFCTWFVSQQHGRKPQVRKTIDLPSVDTPLSGDGGLARQEPSVESTPQVLQALPEEASEKEPASKPLEDLVSREGRAQDAPISPESPDPTSAPASEAPMEEPQGEALTEQDAADLANDALEIGRLLEKSTEERAPAGEVHSETHSETQSERHSEAHDDAAEVLRIVTTSEGTTSAIHANPEHDILEAPTASDAAGDAPDVPAIDDTVIIDTAELTLPDSDLPAEHAEEHSMESPAEILDHEAAGRDGEESDVPDYHVEDEQNGLPADLAFIEELLRSNDTTPSPEETRDAGTEQEVASAQESPEPSDEPTESPSFDPEMAAWLGRLAQDTLGDMPADEILVETVDLAEPAADSTDGADHDTMNLAGDAETTEVTEASSTVSGAIPEEALDEAPQVRWSDDAEVELDQTSLRDDVAADDMPDDRTSVPQEESAADAPVAGIDASANPEEHDETILDEPIYLPHTYLPNPEEEVLEDATEAFPETGLERMEESVILEEDPLEKLAERTGYGVQEMSRWIETLHRKKQVIISGPSGAGKTYLARQLARYLAESGDGFVETIQFHPGYGYEDFIGRAGTSDTPMAEGHFTRFCEEASERSGPCVLLVDEINRADLSRVLGELVYLLEYRGEAMALAGGPVLRVPSNVYLIGTMSATGGQPIDPIVRRRFAVIPLPPRYDVLTRYLKRTGYDAAALVALLEKINTRIPDLDRRLGIAYFLRPDLAHQLEDIWQLEVEPWLEATLGHQPEQVEAYRWARIQAEL